MALSSQECFGTLDGLTYNDDLGWLPGDENLFVKRKSLKRLRKMRRKAGPDAEGEILQETGLSYGEGRGRRFPLRTWPGVDAKAFAKRFPVGRLKPLSFAGRRQPGPNVRRTAPAPVTVGALIDRWNRRCPGGRDGGRSRSRR